MIRSTSSNITINLGQKINLRDLYAFHRNKYPNTPFYEVVYNIELANTILMTIHGYSYKVFASGKVTCLGCDLNTIEDVEGTLTRFLDVLDGFFE